MKPALLLSLGLALAAAACSPPPADRPAPTGAPAVATDGDAAPAAASYFSVPAAQLAHLTIAPVRTATWSTTVRTTGTVDWDNDHTTQAITQVSGPIARIVVDTGARVKVGDPLLYVASADVASATSAYRKAKNRLALASRVLERDRDLLEHKAISQRDLEASQADYNDAATDVQAALETLRVYGVTKDQLVQAERQDTTIQPELAMRAPLAGTIVQKLVLPGQFIEAGTTVAFVISNTGTLWVQGHLHEKDLASVHVGDQVEVRNSSLPHEYHGVVSYIGDVIDPATRTTPVRIVTRNADGLLKKDLFVDVVIHDRTTKNVLVVPTTAILYDEQNFPFVYVQVQPGRFAQRLVTTGGQQDGATEISSGLHAGEPIVTEGSVFLQFATTYQQ